MLEILVNRKRRRHKAKRVLDNQEVIGKYVGDSNSDARIVYIDNAERLHACYKGTLKVVYVDGGESNVGREKGCKYCNNAAYIVVESKMFGTSDIFYAEYCPHCGRKLSENNEMY